MKKIKVLIFNLDAQNDSGKKLIELLNPSAERPLQVKHEAVVESEMPKAPGRLSRILSTFSPDLAFVVVGVAARTGIEVLFKLFRAHRIARPLIAVVTTGDTELVAEVLYHGANDFLIPPFRAVDVLPRVWRWVEESQPEDSSIQKLKAKLGLARIIGESPLLITELKKIPTFARCDATVLIAGQTGTGKEICARALHYLSPRTARPFIALNCGAIPADLIENELFGHHAGAYTGAASSSIGLIGEADAGTLFLDEIHSLSPSAQIKLLRVLQEKEYRPLGSQKLCTADVRIIAATNLDLRRMVQAREFRDDLYYRLSVLTLSLPALRNRPGDIPLLSRHFVAKFTTELRKPAKKLSPAAIQKLTLYEWPGNVRELENMIEQTVVLSEHPIIEGAEIMLPQSSAATGSESFQALKAIAVADTESRLVKQFLAASEGNIANAAKAAKKNRRAFWQLMRKHQITARPCKSVD